MSGQGVPWNGEIFLENVVLAGLLEIAELSGASYIGVQGAFVSDPGAVDGS